MSKIETEVVSHYIEHRPWGSFENLLDTDYCKVKRIIVKPGQRLSYQYHYERNEVWTIVQGEANVTLDGKEHTFKTSDVVVIPELMNHRVQNNGKVDLIFIEVQTGEYFGEDDIVRIEDDYDRVESYTPEEIENQFTSGSDEVEDI